MVDINRQTLIIRTCLGVSVSALAIAFGFWWVTTDARNKINEKTVEVEKRVHEVDSRASQIIDRMDEFKRIQVVLVANFERTRADLDKAKAELVEARGKLNFAGSQLDERAIWFQTFTEALDEQSKDRFPRTSFIQWMDAFFLDHPDWKRPADPPVIEPIPLPKPPK